MIPIKTYNKTTKMYHISYIRYDIKLKRNIDSGD